ncbi:MAG: hypothetical protein ACRDUV_01780, partial [Pseudonocardiaceae bacterium]
DGQQRARPSERLPHLLLDQVAETKSNCESNREAGVTLRCSFLAGVSAPAAGPGAVGRLLRRRR